MVGDEPARKPLASRLAAVVPPSETQADESILDSESGPALRPNTPAPLRASLWNQWPRDRAFTPDSGLGFLRHSVILSAWDESSSFIIQIAIHNQQKQSTIK